MMAFHAEIPVQLNTRAIFQDRIASPIHKIISCRVTSPTFTHTIFQDRIASPSH